MKKKILVLKDGTEKEIISKNGKYYICKNTQFKINSPMIAEIKTEIEKVPIEEAEGFNNFPEESEIKTEKKKTSKKSKKKEGSDK